MRNPQAAFPNSLECLSPASPTSIVTQKPLLFIGPQPCPLLHCLDFSLLILFIFEAFLSLSLGCSHSLYLLLVRSLEFFLTSQFPLLSPLLKLFFMFKWLYGFSFLVELWLIQLGNCSEKSSNTKAEQSLQSGMRSNSNWGKAGGWNKRITWA